jgi:nucleotide-binding universal stress UspA family protein
MFHSLLVPLDGTRFSEHSLPVAEGIARATGASVHLARVHVPHPPDGLLSSTPFMYEGLDMDEYEGRTRAGELGYLRRLADQVAGDASLQVDVALLEGQVARRLEDHAREVEADAVVLTTHAREGLSRAWAGSIAESLIRTTTLPVLALRWNSAEPEPAKPSIEHVLVPLDGSALAEAILAPACDLADAVGARITLVHVVHSGIMGQSRTADAETYLHRIAQRLGDRGIDTDTCVVGSGTASEAICRTAREREVDVVAIATHGRGGVGRALMGSVMLDVLHGTDLPLLVRRPALA